MTRGKIENLKIWKRSIKPKDKNSVEKFQEFWPLI